MKKIIRDIAKFMLILLLLGAVATGGYYGYDYFLNPDKYSDVERELRTKLLLEEVSPFVTPEMTLTLENTPYSAESWVFSDELDHSKPIIMCYGKDMGGNIYVPRNYHTLQTASLYVGPGVPEQDITEYVTQNFDYKCIEISEELLMSLDAGEYYIVCYFITEEGEGPYPALIPLILEEETTFNSEQRGYVNYSDEYGWYLNDLYDVKDITFTFYNLGDNPIKAFAEVVQVGIRKDYIRLDPDDYEINERGDTVTLKKEYLKHRKVNSTSEYAAILTNGDKLGMNYNVVGTVKGDSLQRLTITGPETYSRSAGGDYVATFELNMCDSIYSVGFSHFFYEGGENVIFDERDGAGDIGKYLNLSDCTITIPEEIMQTIEPNSGNSDIHIGYFIDDVWFDAFLTFNVVD